MMSQLSQVNKDSSLKNAYQRIHINFFNFKLALYFSVLLTKLFHQGKSYFKPKPLL